MTREDAPKAEPELVPPTGEAASVPAALLSAGAVPAFYLVCFADPDTKETCVFEQSIAPLASTFEAVLRDLMSEEWPLQPTHVLWCHPEGVRDVSRAFAEIWWRRIEPDFRLGLDRLPVFVERHMDGVALRHWALLPQGRGAN